MASRPSSERLHRHRIDDDRKPAAQQLLAQCACRIAASRRTMDLRRVGESSRHGLSIGPCTDQFGSASAEFRRNPPAHCGAFGLRRLLKALKSTSTQQPARARAGWLVAGGGGVAWRGVAGDYPLNPLWPSGYDVTQVAAEGRASERLRPRQVHPR